MTAQKTAALFLAGLVVLFLWWPPEIYSELGELSSALLFLFLIFCVIRRPPGESSSVEPSGPSPAAVAAFAGFLACLSLSALAGVDAYRSAETALRASSLISFAAGLSWICRDRLARQVETILIGLAACLCVYGLHQYLYSLPRLLVQPQLWSDVSKEDLFPVLTRVAGGRIFSRFALPSTFSCALLAVVPLVHRRVRESQPAWPFAVVLALITTNLVIARSYAALLLFCAYGWADVWARHPRYHRVFLFSSLGLVLLILPVLRPESLLDFSGPANPVRLRLANWSAACSEFLSAPVLGVGPGNFGLLFPAYSAGLTETRYAHGFHMTLLAETGVLGILAGIGLVALFGYWLRRSRPRFAPSLILLFLYALVDIVFELPSLGFLFFLFLGLSTACVGRPVPVRFLKPAMVAVSLAGILFSLVLWFAHGYYEKGMTLMTGSKISRGALQSADGYFVKASQLWPEPKVAAARGQVEMAFYRVSPEENSANLKKAAAHFSEAVRKSPAAVNYRVAYAESLLAMGDTPLATIHLREAARLDPRGPHAGRYTRLILGAPPPDLRR